MLCSNCESGGHLTATGTCEECGGFTTSRSFKLCEDCSEELQECEQCRVSFYTSGVSTPKKGVFFVKKNEKDNNGTAFLKIGEQLHITLPEDQNYFHEWGVDDFDHDVLELEEIGEFEPFPGDYEHGVRTLVFTAVMVGQTDLKLECGSQTWRCKVTVK